MRTPLLLDIAADACPERPALGAGERVHDFETYRARAGRVAAWLAAKGKANTAFLGMNGDALPILLFASGMAGTPFVPLNYRLADSDLNKLIARSAPAVLSVAASASGNRASRRCRSTGPGTSHAPVASAVKPKRP